MQKIVLTAVALSFFIVLHAQDSLLLQMLDSVVVKASRIEEPLQNIPFAASVIGQNQLQLGQAQLTINDALNQVPGVFALNETNFAQDLRVSVRGFGARSAFGIRGIKLIVDGLPESTPDGQAQVDNLAVGLLDQMEVLRGTSSSMYGNASGGVLRLQTEEIEVPLLAQFRTTFGAFGLQQYQLKVGQKLGRFSYILNATHLQFDGFRQNSRVESTRLYAKINYQFANKMHLRLIFNHVDSPVAEDAGALTLDELRNDRRQARDRNLEFQGGEAVQQSRIGAILSRPLWGGQLKAKGFYTIRDFENRLPFQDGGIVNLDRTFIGGGISYTGMVSYGSLSGNIAVGVDLEDQVDDRQRFNNLLGRRGLRSFDQEESFRTIGIYAIHALNLSEHFSARLGLRADFLELRARDRFLIDGDDSGSQQFEQISPSLGLQYRWSRRQQLFASVSSNFETPALSELSNNPSGGGGFNPMLNPQLAINYELGYRGLLFGSLQSELVAYFTQVDKEIVAYELAAFPGRNFYENAAQTNRMGIELSLGYAFAKYWSLQGSYAYSQMEFDQFEDFEGNQLPGIPPHMGFLAVRYQKLRGFYGSIQARYVGEMFVDNANATKDQAYTMVNLRLGYRYMKNGWQIAPFLGINNLLDTTYNANIRINAFGSRYYEPGPGMHLYGGIRLGFVKKRQ